MSRARPLRAWTMLLAVAAAPAESGAQVPLPPTGPPHYAGAGAYSVGSLSRLGAADINVDGYPDLTWLSYHVAFALNNGHGRFGATHTVTTTGLNDFAFGDMNGDGKPDLVMGDDNPPGVQISRGDGLGGFGPATQFLGDKVTHVRLCDANLDGDLDVVAGLQTAAFNARVYLGNGDGTLGQSFGFGTMPYNPEDLDVADWNLDGIPDAVVGKLSPGVSVYRGDGSGAMVFSTALTVGGQSIHFTDLDGDGWLDVAGWDAFGSYNVTIQRSDGAGGFLPKEKQTFTGTGVLPIDIDADGRDELLTPHAADGVAVCEIVGPAFVKSASLPYRETGALLAAADVDLDGVEDLLFTSDFGNGPRVYRGRAGGGFEDLDLHALPAGSSVRDVRLVHLDGDGKLDLITSDGINDRLTISAGVGDGTFLPATLLTTGPDCQDIELADVDLDGRVDVVLPFRGAAEPNTNSVGAHLGDGQLGVSALISSPLPFAPQGLRVADFTGDGIPDAVVASQLSDIVAILAGDGQGGFAPTSGSQSTAIVGLPGMALGDIDQDGDIDVVLVDGTRLQVLDSDGAGGLAPAYDIPQAGVASFTVALPDLNHDGILDVAVSTSIAGSIGLLRGNGQGQFTLTDTAGTNYLSALRMVITDVDGDGNDDVVTTSPTSLDMVQVVRTDGDGFARDWSVTHAGDLVTMASIAAGDVDGDGRADLAVGDDDGRVAVLINRYQPDSWLSLGGGSPGQLGTPRLSGAGSPVAGQTVSLTLQNAAPSKPLVLLIGGGQAPTPLAGGWLIPQPQLAIGPVVSDAQGSLQLGAPWPVGPGGVTLYFQAWIGDPTSVGGVAASGAAALQVP